MGLFRMRDRGAEDFKALGVPHSDPLFGDYHDLGDIPKAFLLEVGHFFKTYKQLEGAEVESLGWAPGEDAIQEVRASVERYGKRRRKAH